MKKWLSLAAVVVLCLALVIGIACGGGEGEEEEAGVRELKFGFGLPMTGATGAAVGVPAKYAFSMAAEKVGVFEVGGKQYEWKPIFEDNLFTIDGGTKSATKFIYDHDVDFMHQAGPDPGVAASTITEKIGMLLDTAGANWESFGPDKPHFFQVAATWHFGAASFFDWLLKEHPEVQRVAMSESESIIGVAILDAYEKNCEYYGLELKAALTPMGVVEYYPIATKLMAGNPDLVYGSTDLFNAMWDMGYDGLCVSSYWTEAAGGEIDWDRSADAGLLIYMPHPIPGLWPETDAIRVEYEDRYGVELTPAAYWAINVLFIYTQGLQQAGTVTDMDKIVEALETGTFDSQAGPVYFGGEVLNGIGHLIMWPNPIYKIVGKQEYEVITVHTPEEVEALSNKVYK